MKIKVTPAYGYAHGHAEKILIAIGASSISTDPDGIVTAEVTPQQFEMFQLRGVAHRAEVLPEFTAPVPPPIPQPTIERDALGRQYQDFHVPIPTMEEVLKAGYSKKAAKRIIARQKTVAALLAEGKEDEARAVMNSTGPVDGEESEPDEEGAATKIIDPNPIPEALKPDTSKLETKK
jgi:hypothetical protein